MILSPAAQKALDRHWRRLERLGEGLYPPQRQRSVTAATTLTVEDHMGLVAGDATAGALTFTLPTASTVPGMLVYVAKTDAGANAITVGSVSLTAANPTRILISDGVAWRAF